MDRQGLTQAKTRGLIYLGLSLCLVNFSNTPVLGRELPTSGGKSKMSMPVTSVAQKTSTEIKSKNMALTDNEKQIAKELGFDEAVLLLIKERLNPEMGIVKSGGLEWEEKSFLQEDYNQPILMLDKDVKSFNDVASKYPELKELVDSALHRGCKYSREQLEASAEARAIERLGREKFERQKKYRLASEPFHPLIEQELQDTYGKPKVGLSNRPITPETYLDSDKALDDAIAELHTKYDGQTLRPENRAKSQLALKYRGVGDSLYAPDARMESLRAELTKLGYRITDERDISDRRVQFETKAEAEKYLRDVGMNIDSLSLDHQKKSQYKALYPIDYAKDFLDLESTKTIVAQSSHGIDTGSDSTAQMVKLIMDSPESFTGGFLEDAGFSLRLLPGSTVTKFGDRQWLIEQPERFTASPRIRVSTVFKTPKGSSGFDMVKAQGTSGINYGIDNDHVIEKLKYWDKKYGVTVIEATFEGMKISFKKLPDDLSELCTEFFLFCPEIELSDDEHRNAAVMREIADKFRKTKVMSFWWD
ncbi:MAG: hypothetical protein QG574_5552 [Cyanobacteriota bacterium erpe_2018_sw_21hr_WHONDRS-SW48-000092_B_bin.40]|jgi:hypothetical protein|nr:hypothetical protein [Cyanobacteriota bacterium erpe_2018_sw_21hr_WHONDRS-SW48-000092_B_bin.40]